MRLNRRSFLAMTAGGLLVPRRLRADPPAVEHKFLFIFCSGGWDVTKVFAPQFGNPNVDMDATDEEATANGIAYCASPLRTNVTTFFEQYGDRACVLNGMEVRSITHERCTRIVLTGSTETGRDDWAATLAGLSQEDLLLPHLVVTGSSFTSEYTSKVVRVGSNGQLPALLDGSALNDLSDVTLSPASSGTTSRVNAWLRQRVSGYEAAAAAGAPRRFGAGYGTMLDQLDAIAGMAGDLQLSSPLDGCTRDIAGDSAIALSCFERGIARCAMVRSQGMCEMGWDTHSDNAAQDNHYNQLFAYLSEVMADLDTRTATDGSPLADHVTIVVMSEMGRTPRINGNRGRDHWTYTSAMLLGAGIRGGAVVGGMDADFLGRPIDLASGEPTDSGTRIVPGNLGATLLAIADIDPAEVGILDEPIGAMRPP